MPVHLPPAGWSEVRAHAEAASRENGTQLTSLRATVLRALWEARIPLGAYELTARLNAEAAKPFAPNSVYRALDYLETTGLVHKIASRQAYALLPPAGPCHPVLMTCNGCGRCIILEGSPIHEHLRQLARQEGFAPDRHVVEVGGECGTCLGAKSS